LLAKMFHEKDIPIQVAVGNYNLGICGMDWVEELMVKYPSSPLIELRNLGYGTGTIVVVAGRAGEAPDIERIRAKEEIIRIVSEYPNMAESFALKNRLRRFSIFSVWGAAEVYPPESAELALVRQGEDSLGQELVPVSDVLGFSACLIASKDSWEKEDLSEILASIDDALRSMEKPPSPAAAKIPDTAAGYPVRESDVNEIRLALPDGHQQEPAARLLRRAGITVNDYPSETDDRRPSTNLERVAIKVIRPQDMPLQVANGNFDLAVTGRDWVLEHLYQFPSSPVVELLDLESSRVKVVAVVSNELAVDDIQGLRQLYAEGGEAVRVASEYVSIADRYSRDNHLGGYKVIPTWGATEAFLPEDADLLIENTETGGTIARHNLRIIDTLFESTARLIGNKISISDPAKGDRIRSIMAKLRKGIEDS